VKTFYSTFELTFIYFLIFFPKRSSSAAGMDRRTRVPRESRPAQSITFDASRCGQIIITTVSSGDQILVLNEYLNIYPINCVHVMDFEIGKMCTHVDNAFLLARTIYALAHILHTYARTFYT
jgi:hypothetical protein